MKKMDCEIISREKVRPSSPTPQHLQTYKLSMLDQIVPPMLVAVVLYYYFPNTMENITSHNPHFFISETTQLLKRSLSLILTRFYPFAGKLNTDGLSVDCNDQGVPFAVIKFTGHKLSDLLKNSRDPNFYRFLIPGEICNSSTVAMIQINYFDCGGVAIGVVFSHKVADATSISNFLQSWAAAATTRGGSCNDAVCPNYIAQSMFPHKQEISYQSTHPLAPILKTGKSAVMRRYVFDKMSISKLKAKSSGVERPTRVEAVSALIWKCFMAASNSSASVLTHAVNLRRRAQPPFSSDCFGNFVGFTCTAATKGNNIEKDHIELGRLVRKIRDGISKIDSDYINRMYGDEGVSGYRQNLGLTWSEVPDQNADVLGITSWCNLGLYDIDFGFGKPVWLTGWDTAGDDSGSRLLNVVWLKDNRDGDGIEAWVVLDEKYVSVFDDAEDLRALASNKVVDNSA